MGLCTTTHAEAQRSWLRAFAQPTTYLGVMMLIIVGIVTAYSIQKERNDTFDAALRNGDNLTRLFEQHLARIIKGADGMLRAMRNAYLDNPKAFDIEAWTRRQDFSNDTVLQLTIVGADGFARANSNGSLKLPIYVGDREDVRVHVDATSDELFIGAPLKLRSTGKWVFNVTRRLTAPDGSFAGIVAASIDAPQLVTFYNSIDLGKSGSATVLGFDGNVRVRRGSNGIVADEAFGKSLSDTPLFKLARQVPAGHYWGEAETFDGVRRLISLRAVQDLPLIVSVGFSEETIFATAWHNARMYVGSAAILTIAVGMAIWMAAVRQRHLVTEQEHLRRAARAEIERAEAERARALAEAEVLREREKAAEAANQAKSSFLAVMSHEIRTPMNAVLGLTNMLFETNLDDEQRSSVVAIHEAGDSLLGILNDILDFSQLESGQITLEHIAFSPQALVDTVQSIMGPRAKAKGLALRVVKDPLMPRVLTGDVSRIRQVLLNFVGNAVKFTEAGEVVVDARCTGGDEGQIVIEWSVSDTGIGIPPERIGALFRDFVQADSSINRRYGGSGLGLAICKRIVERMGGNINVISTPGQGSRFQFALTLPLADEASLAAHDEVDCHAALKQEIASRGRPLRIIIADDHPTNRLVAAKMLKPFDCQIDMAANGVEAVMAATASPPDLILMDMRMPEMDGLQAARSLRARGGEFATIPIIAFTANAFAADVNACLQAGMNDFITKPVRKNALIGAVLRAIRGDRTVNAGNAGQTTALQPFAAMPEPPASSIDRAAIEELLAEIGEDAASEAFHLFVAETENRLKLLRQMTATNRPAIEHEAHALKGSAATFGLREVSQLAGRLELDAAIIAMTEYGVLLDRLDAAFEASRTQFAVQIPIAA